MYLALPVWVSCLVTYKQCGVVQPGNPLEAAGRYILHPPPGFLSSFKRGWDRLCAQAMARQLYGDDAVA